MNKKRIALATAIIWIVNFVYGFLTCGMLFKWMYELPPNIWLSAEDIMSLPNTVGSLVVGLIGALFFTLVYALIHKGIPEKGAKKGLIYGFLVWLIGPFIGIASMPFYMTVSTLIIAYWLAVNLVRLLIIGSILGAIYKK